MVNNARTGRADAIRSYLAEHPRSTLGEIATGLNDNNKRQITKDVFRMKQRGMIVGTKDAMGMGRYSVGRPPTVAASPDKIAKRRAEYLKARRDAQRAARPEKPVKPPKPKPAPPPKIRCESVDEFIAHGGRIEIIETQWRAPDRYPVMHPDFRSIRRGNMAL